MAKDQRLLTAWTLKTRTRTDWCELLSWEKSTTLEMLDCSLVCELLPLPNGKNCKLTKTFRLFLNLVELKKDQGMYVGADGPHAWLEGGE